MSDAGFDRSMGVDKGWISLSSRETLRLARAAARTPDDRRRIDDTEERLRRNGFIVRCLPELQYNHLLKRWKDR